MVGDFASRSTVVHDCMFRLPDFDHPLSVNNPVVKGHFTVVIFVSETIENLKISCTQSKQ
jgi:hypothetical protein